MEQLWYCASQETLIPLDGGLADFVTVDNDVIATGGLSSKAIVKRVADESDVSDIDNDDDVPNPATAVDVLRAHFAGC